MTTPKPDGSQPSARKRASSSPRSISRRSGKTVKAAVDDFLLDRQSQNHSPQTLRWHIIAFALPHGKSSFVRFKHLFSSDSELVSPPSPQRRSSALEQERNKAYVKEKEEDFS